MWSGTGYTEVSSSDETYQTEYSNMRASFLLQYRPELLGDLTEPQRPQQWDEKSVMEFMKQIEQRTEAATGSSKDRVCILIFICTGKQAGILR